MMLQSKCSKSNGAEIFMGRRRASRLPKSLCACAPRSRHELNMRTNVPSSVPLFLSFGSCAPAHDLRDACCAFTGPRLPSCLLLNLIPCRVVQVEPKACQVISTLA